MGLMCPTPKCNSILLSSDLYCVECGAKLVPSINICNSCKKELSRYDKFCGKCGKSTNVGMPLATTS